MKIMYVIREEIIRQEHKYPQDIRSLLFSLCGNYVPVKGHIDMETNPKT
jgi:hypothetical protein